MGLNFDGIGFAFAAKDDGLLAYQKQVLAGFTSINDQVAKMGKGGGMGPPAPPPPPPPTSNNPMSRGEPSKKGPGLWLATGAAAGKAFDTIFSKAKSASRGVGGLSEITHKLGSILGQLRLGNFLEGLSLANLNQITDAMEKLGGAGRNLTTGLESEFTSMGKTSKATFANMGMGADQIKKLSGQAAGMAKGLNIDIGKATDSLYSMSFAQEQFAAIGVKSASDLAKFSEVTGGDLKGTATMLKTLSNGYGLSDASLKQLMSSTLAYGQEAGDVGATLNKMPALMEQLSKTTDRYGNVLRGADLAAFAQESVALSAGFYSIYKDAGKAEAATAAISTALAAGRAGYSDLFTGVQSDMPKILTDLSIVGGDFSKAFDMLQKGPEGFAAGMVEMSQEVGRTGGNVTDFAAKMRSRMKDALGEDATNALTDMMTKGGEGLKDVMKKSHEATVTISEIGKAGFSTGRTLAESMSLIEDNFEMGFRKIGMASTRTFVKDSGKNFKMFGDQLRDLAGEDGPLGAVITKLSEVSSQGVTAFLPPSLKPAAALFGKLASTFGPTLGILGSLGFRFSMLASPLTLLAVPLAFVTTLFGDLVMHSYNAETKTYDLESAFDKLGVTLTEWFAKIPGLWANFKAGVSKTFDWLLKNVPLLWAKIAPQLKAGWDNLITWIRNDLPVLLSKAFTYAIDLANWVRSLIEKVDWNGLGSTFFENFTGIFAKGGVAEKLLSSLWETFKSIAIPLMGLVTKLIKSVNWTEVGNTLGTWFGNAVKIAIAGFSSNKTANAGPLGEAFKGLVSAAWAGIKGLASGLWTALEKELGTAKASLVVAGALLLSPLGGMLTTALVGSVTKIAWPLFVQPLLTKMGAVITATDSTGANVIASAIGKLTTRALALSGLSTVWSTFTSSFASSFAGSVGAAELFPSIPAAFAKLTSWGAGVAASSKDLFVAFTAKFTPRFAAAMSSGSVVASVGASLGTALSTALGFLATSPALIASSGGVGVAIGAALVVGAGAIGYLLGNKIIEWFDLNPSAWGDALYNWMHPKEEGDLIFTKMKTGADAATTQIDKTTAALQNFNMEADANKLAEATKKRDPNFLVVPASPGGQSIVPEWRMPGAIPPLVPPKPLVTDEAEMSNLISPGGAKRSAKSLALVRQEAEQLPKAFSVAYAELTPKTAQFYENYITGFKGFIKTLNTLWLKSLDDMLLAMDIVVKAVTADSATLNADVMRMTAQLIQLQKEKDKTLSMTAAVAPPIVNMAGMENLPENFKVLAQLISEPAWYARYEILFTQKMNELRTDLQRLSTSGGGVTAGGAPQPSASSGARTTMAGLVKKGT